MHSNATSLSPLHSSMVQQEFSQLIQEETNRKNTDRLYPQGAQILVRNKEDYTTGHSGS